MKGPRRVTKYNSPSEVEAAKAAEGITSNSEKQRREEQKASNYAKTSETIRRRKNWW